MTAAARAQHALAGANDPNLENFSKHGAQALLGSFAAAASHWMP
jgi:hypothetical protein